MTTKPGRNRECPCGSGRKYKRSCLNSPTMSPRILNDIAERFAAQELAEARRKAAYGDVRPVISTQFQEHRFVAVGSTLHFSAKWNTFADFLMDYFKHSFGSGWGQAELAKPLEDAHRADLDRAAPRRARLVTAGRRRGGEVG